MFDVRHKSIPLIPSRSAVKEMMQLGFTLSDCKEMLEQGYDAPRKRASGTEEKWYDKGSKTYNIVIVKSVNYMLNEEIYLITHVGEFSR